MHHITQAITVIYDWIYAILRREYRAQFTFHANIKLGAHLSVGQCDKRQSSTSHTSHHTSISLRVVRHDQSSVQDLRQSVRSQDGCRRIWIRGVPHAPHASPYSIRHTVQSTLHPASQYHFRFDIFRLRAEAVSVRVRVVLKQKLLSIRLYNNICSPLTARHAKAAQSHRKAKAFGRS